MWFLFSGEHNPRKAVNQKLLDKLKKYEIATVRHYHDADLQNVKAGMQTEVEPVSTLATSNYQFFVLIARW